MIAVALLVLLFCMAVAGLFVWDRYYDHSGNEWRNDVMLYLRGRQDDIRVTYMEYTSDSKACDAYVFDASRILQTYRIEGSRVLNFRSLWYRHWHDERRNKFYAPDETLNQLPNVLESEAVPLQSPNDGPSVTIVDISTVIWGATGSVNMVRWGDRWRAQKWTGTPDEAPAEVEVFRQRMAQAQTQATPISRITYVDYYKDVYPLWTRKAATLPGIGDYPAYLRAIPLFTEKELEARKDTLLIDLEKARPNVQVAVQQPYTLLPISPKRSPFPKARKFTPGDKFRVNYKGDWFLIETFANGSIGSKAEKL